MIQSFSADRLWAVGASGAVTSGKKVLTSVKTLLREAGAATMEEEKEEAEQRRLNCPNGDKRNFKGR